MEIRKLNMLRGIAALIVVVSHYSNLTGFLGGLLGDGGGQFGVMIFFVISGFLMSYLYITRDFKKGEICRFAVARVARVVPLFVIVVLFSYALQVLDLKGVFYNIPDGVSLFSHLVLFSGTSVLWTIPAEIQFYILFVFFWWLLSKQEGYLYIFLALIFIFLIFINFPRLRGYVFAIPFDISLMSSLPYFFVGMIFGRIYGRWSPPDYLVSGVFIFALLIIPLLYPKIFSFLVGYEHGMWQDVGILSSISIVFFLVVFLVPDKNIILSNNIGDFLGKISYSLYLLHMPVLHMLDIPILWRLNKLALEYPSLCLPVFLTVVIFVSYFSYLFIEAPSRNLIRSVTS